MRSRHLSTTALAAISVGALLTSCGRSAEHGANPAQTSTASHVTSAEECPHNWPWSYTPGMEAIKKNVEKLTGGRDNVPEYNDCQRFIVGSSNAPSYGAVFAVFASDSLARKEWSDQAQVSALVLADDAYPPLGIKSKGFHCLVMTPTNQPATQWKAEMVPAGTDADCTKRKTAEAVVLDVDARPNIPGTSKAIPEADLPGVVRWGFSPGPEGRVTWVQYVTLPCAKSLCFVGPPGFQARPTFAVLSSMNGSLNNSGSRRRVDVWNDVQYLAAPTSGISGPKPDSPLLEGVILPDAKLAERKIDDYDDRWVKVAEVAISGSGYLSKLNFAATTGAVSRYNVIYACYYEEDGSGGFGSCGDDPADKAGLAALTCGATDTYPGRWRTKHVNAANPSQVSYHCVEFIPFDDSALTVPGTVRWKWLANDEMTWFRCPAGCCKELE